MDDGQKTANFVLTYQTAVDIAVGKPNDLNTRDKIVSGNFVSLKCDKEAILIDGKHVDIIYFDPWHDGYKMYYKPVGAQYFKEIMNSPLQFDLSATGIEQIGRITPTSISVGKNYPNPFGAEGTRLPVTLAKETRLSIKVFDALGKEALVPEAGANYSAGRHEFGISLQGLPSGIYFCKVVTPEGTQTVKMNYRQ